MKKVFRERIQAILLESEVKPSFSIFPEGAAPFKEKSQNNQVYSHPLRQNTISLSNKFPISFCMKKEPITGSIIEDIEHFKNFRSSVRGRPASSSRQAKASPLMSKISQALTDIQSPVTQRNQHSNGFNTSGKRSNAAWPSNFPVAKKGISQLCIKIEQLSSRQPSERHSTGANGRMSLDNCNITAINHIDQSSQKERKKAEDEKELKAFGKFILRKKDNNARRDFLNTLFPIDMPFRLHEMH